MTIPGSEVVPTGAYGASGLEDLDVNDLRMPRLSIDKEEGAWSSSMGDEKMEYITAIPLGVIKQRVLWQASIGDENLGPMCKSPNAKEGYPTVKGKNEELFPWQAAQFNPGDFPLNAENRPILPCTSCRLAQWGSHPVDGKKAWCSEQWTIPIIYGIEDDEPMITALITAQRSSLAPAKGFFASLMQQQKPAFSRRVVLRLKPQMRGKNKYYVPAWSVVGETDPDEWPTYSQSYLQIRDYVSRPPRGDEDASVNATAVASDNVVQGSFTQQTWAPGTAAQPVQQPVQVQQAVPMQAPIAQPVAQPASQPFTQTVAPPQNTTARDNDDLPF